MYWYFGYCWYIGISHSMSLCLYVTSTTLVLLFICAGTMCTAGTLAPATLCLCSNMLLVPQWYCCIYVLVLWVLLVHWYQALSLSVPLSYWYCTGTTPYIYWYCGYNWYIGASYSMSLCIYVTATTLVLLFIWTGTVETVHTLVPPILCLWKKFFAGTAVVLLFVCSGIVGTVGTLAPGTLCLCTNMLLVLHWYCSLFVLVLSVQLKYCCQLLSVSLPICYWYHSGTAAYVYWYCRHCWYIGTRNSMSLCLYVTGTTLVLLFIWTGTVGTVGTFVTASLCLCTNMLVVLHWYGSLYVLALRVLLVHWCQPLYVSVLICYWYHTGTSLFMHWYCGCCWYIGTSHSISLYQYVTGTALVLLFICTGTVGTIRTLVPATLCLSTNMVLVKQ